MNGWLDMAVCMDELMHMNECWMDVQHMDVYGCMDG